MKKKHLELAHELLDRQLIDAEGIPCGRVDDLELAGGPGEELRIRAILVGPGAAARRMPELLRTFVSRITGARVVRVPWEYVDAITSKVELACTAAELGLNRGEARTASVISRIPGS